MFAGWPSVVASCWIGVGVVVLFVSVCVWRVLGYPVGGLCRRGYRGQVLQVAVVCGVQSYVFELWSVVGVLVFGMRVHESIAVCAAVGLLFDDVQGVLGVHAFEGHPRSQRLCGEAGFEHPVEGSLGARLKPNVVPAKLFQCSRLSGRNKKTSKFIYPPTKPTRTWWQNMLFASLGGPRWYAHICCPARCHVKKTCFQKQFLLEHHWNTAGTSYWNVAGTSTLQQEQSTRKGKMVTYIVV